MTGMQRLGLPVNLKGPMRPALSALLLLLLPACGGGTTSKHDVEPSNQCQGGDVLVSGTVTRDLGPAFQYVGPTVLGTDSSARITLSSNPSFGGDGASKLVAVKTLQPAPALPFEYCLTGALADVSDTTVEYAVDVEVRQHEGQSVGDLIMENLEVVEPPAANVELRVTGVEDCTSPEAGGFCVAAP